MKNPGCNRIRLAAVALVMAVMPSACTRSSGDRWFVSRVDTTLVRLATTPVRNQRNLPTCWIHAMLACLETEQAEWHGDTVNLSAKWLVHSHVKELEREQRSTEDKRSFRGMGPDALQLIARHGLIPAGMAQGREDSIPCHGEFLTAQEYGRRICPDGEWQWLTSFAHHPYGQPFALEVPDNVHGHRFLNLPPDSLLAVTLRTLRSRHPVFWEGTMKAPRKLTGNAGEDITLRRQRLFEDKILTDDHAVALIGLCRTPDGEECLIFKNSYGPAWGMDGYGLMPVREFLLRTIMIGIPRARS